MKKSTVNNLILATTVITCLLIADFIAGIYVKKTGLSEKIDYIEAKLKRNQPPVIGAFDPDFGWGFMPNAEDSQATQEFNVTYSINSHALRDAEILPKKPKGIVRILALGESNVFGEGIQYGKRFSEIIEDTLDNVEVINLGVWAFGIDQSLLLLQREGFQFDPDIVTLFICVPDFLERAKYARMLGQFKPRFVPSPNNQEFILQDIRTAKKNFAKNPSTDTDSIQSTKRKKELFQRAILATKSNIITLLGWSDIKESIQQKSESVDETFWKNLEEKVLAERNSTRFGYAYNQRDFERLILFLLKQFKIACDSNNVDLVIISASTVMPQYIKKYCSALNIDHIDLKDTLTVAVKQNPIRYEIDPHYNEFYHQVVGEYMSQYFKEKYSLKEKVTD